MKSYSASIGELFDGRVTHPHPERTASRQGTGIFAPDRFQIWPNRASMARSIRMQESAGTTNPWRAVVKLGITEGY